MGESAPDVARAGATSKVKTTRVGVLVYHTCIHPCVYIYIYIMSVYVHTYIVCVCIYIYIYTYIHMKMARAGVLDDVVGKGGVMDAVLQWEKR